MNNCSRNILVVGIVLIGATAALLAYFSSHQKLGHPGLKVVAQPIFDPEGKRVAATSAYLPEKVLGYSSKPVPITPVELDFLPQDTTFGRRLYTAEDGFQLQLGIVLMGTDRTSIHRPQYCLTGQGWRIDQTEQLSIGIPRPYSYDLPVNKLTTTGVRETSEGARTIGRALYVYWFVSENQLTSDHLQRMWWMARDLMFTGILQRWAYVSCFAMCLPGQEDATYDRMKRFLAEAVPEFQMVSGAKVAGSDNPSHGNAAPPRVLAQERPF